MTTNEVFEKYKHLDALLSDREFLGNDLRMVILADLWQAVRLTSVPADRLPVAAADGQDGTAAAEQDR